MAVHDTGARTVFCHRYHIVWITKYRYKVLDGVVRGRIREIIRQVCAELGAGIVKGVLSRDHVHMMVSIPPHLAVSGVVRRMKGSPVAQGAARVSGPQEALLGPALLGQGLLLPDQRQRHRRHHASVY